MSALAAAPSLHDGLPGILGLAAVAVMVAVPLWLRARRAARRTLSHHQPAPAAEVIVQPRETLPYDEGQSPVVVAAEGIPE